MYYEKKQYKFEAGNQRIAAKVEITFTLTSGKSQKSGYVGTYQTGISAVILRS